MNIPQDLQKRSIFVAKIATVFEKMRLYSPISTVIRATAKTIDVPELTVDDAKNHALYCQNTIGTATPATTSITIDIKTDKSIDYCDEDFRDDLVGFKELTKNEILNVVTRKVNKNFTDAVLAGATAVTGTVDLSTNDAANKFLSKVAVEAGESYFSWKPRVEHGNVVPAKYQGKGFVIAGREAYENLLATTNSIRFQSTTSGQSADMNMFVSLQGVVVMNAGAELGNLKQVIYGVAGAPLHVYRSDKINEWDTPVTSRTTAATASGDVTAGDSMILRNYNMGAEIWNKAVVPTQMAAFVKKQLMA